MDFSDLSGQYGDFSTPAFTVSAGGRDLVRELFLSVANAEVDLKERTAGRFSFTVTNAYDWETRSFVARGEEETVDLLELFAFGSPVEIRLGYGDPSGLRPMARGIVTEIGTSFSEGETPELIVSGYDDLYPLTTGKNTRHWEGARDSDAVLDLVRVTGLTADVRNTDPVKARIDQGQEADISFLDKLAARNGATFYARGNRFYFGPRNNDRSDALELAWGQGLLTFSPEGNLARQVESVEVHGWSTERGEAILGRASRGDETGRDGGRQSGAERIASALNNRPTMRVRAAVHTQAEADARARAILEERAQEFLKGEGESIGLPEVIPDTNVAFQGLGAAFSKTYYVNAAKHTIGDNGYRTSFCVQETTV